MKKSSTMGKVGVYAFAVGVFLAILAAFVPQTWQYFDIVIATLVVLGIVVGFLNVTDEETQGFLMASVAISIAVFTAGTQMDGLASTLGVAGQFLNNLLFSINIFVFPATIVVGIKSIYSLAKD